MNIIISGTSSAGKSSIIDKFPKQYNKISFDNVFDEFGYNFFKVCEYKNLKNKYYTQKEKDKFFYDCLYGKIISKLNIKKNNLIDIVDDFDDFDDKSVPIIRKYIPNNIQILIYTNLDKLADNLNNRKSYDPRGTFVYDQFTKYYENTNNKDEAIDTINYNNFIKSLKKIKYEFESEKNLIDLARFIFKKLGIKKIVETENYFIKPRSNCYDLVLNTKNKKPDELKNAIIDYLSKIA